MNITASEKTYRCIREKLESGELLPGEKLVTRTLAQQLGVSLSPVREAINRLASEGLIQHTPGAGAAVKQITIEELDELYVLRDAIESCAVGIATETMSPIELSGLEELLNRQQVLAEAIASSKRKVATVRQIENWLKLEEQFHQTIIRCSRNKLLAKVNGEHRALVKIFESQMKHSSLLNQEVALSTVAGKRKLIAFIHARDAVSARQHMSQQIQTGRNTVIGHLRRQGMV